MTSPPVRAAIAALVLAAGPAGCASSDDVSPAAEPPVSSAPAASDAPAAALDPPPPTVTLPDLSRLSESLQQQIREQHERARGGEAPGAARGDPFGELGMILTATELFDTAADAFLNAHALAPTVMRWPYYLADLSRQRGDTARAIEFYERAVELDPGYPAALVWLGEMYLDDSRPVEAAAVFDQALALDAGSAAALSGVGRAALANGDAPRAVEYLERALEFAPAAWNIHYSLAGAYRTLGDLEKVEAHLQPRSGDPPRPADPLMEAYDGLLQSARAFENRGTQAMGEGRYDEAAAIFREGLAGSPDDPSLHYWLGSALMMSGDTRGAGEQFDTALRLDPEFPQAHLGLGVLLNASRRYDEAADRFRRAVELQPSYLPARLGYVDALRALGRTDEVLAQLDRVVELDPSFVDGWMARAMMQLQLGRFRGARDGLQEALLAHAGHPGLTDLLARILATAPDDSVRDGVRALALMRERFEGPASLDMYETLALALAEVGRYEEAAEIQRQAMSAAEQNGRPEVARAMAEALSLYENRRPARELFGRPTP